MVAKFFFDGNFQLHLYIIYTSIVIIIIPDLSSKIQTSRCKKVSIPRKNTTFYMGSMSIEGTDNKSIQIPDLQQN